jgi:hypothetical protein
MQGVGPTVLVPFEVTICEVVDSWGDEFANTLRYLVMDLAPVLKHEGSEHRAEEKKVFI